MEEELFKSIASQLRQPHGEYALQIGDKMNASNSLLYNYTIEAMQLVDYDFVLEIGFGNGKFFDKLFAKANHLNISGIDFSAEMVKAATNNNQPLIQSNKLILKLGNSNQLPFADNSFDKIFCINVIYFWENTENHLKEIYRVLKPKGKFYTTIRSKESMLLMPFTKYGFNLYTETEWKHFLERNNFILSQSLKITEPEFELNSKNYSIESLCFIAEKLSII